jgi:hypothetical protein
MFSVIRSYYEYYLEVILDFIEIILFRTKMEIVTYFYNRRLKIVRGTPKQIYTDSIGLYKTLAVFLVPRLEEIKRFSGHPMDLKEDEWIIILDKMIVGFKIIETDIDLDESSKKIVDESLELFAKYYLELWM